MSALVKINDVYYFRMRIPKDVRGFFPRPEIVKSTQSKRTRLFNCKERRSQYLPLLPSI